MIKKMTTIKAKFAVLVIGLLSGSAFAQSVPASLPPSSEMNQSKPVEKISLGQTEQEVIRILGIPSDSAFVPVVVRQYATDHSKIGDLIGAWPLSPQDTLVVIVGKGGVEHIHHVNPQSAKPDPVMEQVLSLSSSPTESPEHKVARLRHEVDILYCAKFDKEQAETREALGALQKYHEQTPVSQWTRESIDREHSLVQDLSGKSSLISSCHDNLVESEHQLERADDCAKVIVELCAGTERRRPT
jgi:hypothetical protein